MPAVVDTPQEPSNLKTTLLAPVRWLVICVFAALTIILFLFALLLALVAIPLDKLYRFAGGKYPEAIEQMIPGINGEIAQAIRNTPQTTHDSATNREINVNAQALRNHYEEPDVIESMKEFINESKYKENEEQDPKKYKFTEYEAQYALKCLQRIQISTDTHSISKLTLKHILNLVWKACNDESTKPNISTNDEGKKSAEPNVSTNDEDKESTEPNVDINKRIIERKYQLVKHLIDAETEYGSTWHTCLTGTFNAIVTSLYRFEEFTFLEKKCEMEIKLKFKHDLKKKGEELFNQLPNDEAKRKAAEDLESKNPPSTNFVLSFIETFQDHPAREVLGNQECDRLVMTYLANLQYTEAVAQYTRES